MSGWGEGLGTRKKATAARQTTLLAAKGVVLEAFFGRERGCIEVAYIGFQVAGHRFSSAIPIEFANKIPLRTHQRGIGVLQRLVGILVIVHLRKEGLSARHAFRVCRMHGGAFFEQALDDFKRRSKANVVGVGLEGQPKDGHALAFYNPQRLMDFLKEPVDALLVDALSGFQNLEVHANLGGQMDERLYVLWKTETTIAKPGFEELATDTRIESHGMGHFLDVGADFFAQVGDDVCITDLQRKERIRGVLDKFRAVDGGDQEFGFVSWWTGPVVNWTAKTFFANGAIDFAEFIGTGRILHRENDAARVHKIINRSPFAKKFRIGCHALFYVSVFGIGGDCAAQFEPRTRGDGAFLDDKFGRFRFGGDLASYVVDGR